ncbi:prolipoprotein diacylglyceryl transferase [Paenibacillus woosongensis]|uniref:Phosphatidylglycerol--prolipoprotein diacylglyceryl transferase n=1 Tax=Paenibacillus woosongensis TaxID=307580 RepID=A0AA95L174_9BACL|nr:prolipoprotein diacylglyceryl transferase [Paenibacillus woosongensis]WHX49434.1 prolipoprotein diacylglyceryl transferase [Paenibacillus woosongensis]
MANRKDGTMKNDLLQIGPVTVYGYGLMIAIGIIVAYRVLIHRAGTRQIAPSDIATLTLRGLLFGFIGAKVLYWITQYRNIIDNPRILLDLSAGYVVYGGIIGGILAGYVYCRKKRMNFLQCLDLFAPSIALAQGFGRIGCFLAGCCYGAETDSWFGIIFHESHYAPNGVTLVPTQLFESAFNFALFFVLIYIAKRVRQTGLIASLYLLLYSVGRFVIEFYRGDIIRGNVGMLSTSQWIAIIVFMFTCAVLLPMLIKSSARPSTAE